MCQVHVVYPLSRLTGYKIETLGPYGMFYERIQRVPSPFHRDGHIKQNEIFGSFPIALSSIFMHFPMSEGWAGYLIHINSLNLKTLNCPPANYCLFDKSLPDPAASLKNKPWESLPILWIKRHFTMPQEHPYVNVLAMLQILSLTSYTSLFICQSQSALQRK